MDQSIPNISLLYGVFQFWLNFASSKVSGQILDTFALKLGKILDKRYFNVKFNVIVHRITKAYANSRLTILLKDAYNLKFAIHVEGKHFYQI